MSAKQSEDQWKLYNRSVETEFVRIKIDSLDNRRHKAAEDIFLRNQAARRALASKQKFTVVVTTTVEESYIHPAELRADSKVNIKEPPFVDKDNCVFLHHSAVTLAKKRGDTHIVVLRFKSALSERERMAIILRLLSKRNSLPTMARTELIRIAKDELDFAPEEISELMVGRRGAKAVSEVMSEYRAAKFFAEFASHETQYGHRKLGEDCVSKVKFLYGRSDIRTLMDESKQVRETFADIVIISTINNEKRFQDFIPKIMKYPDTRELLLQGQYQQAKYQLNLMHPETNKAKFPLLDIQNVRSKIFDPETLKVIVDQAENADGTSEFTVALLEIAKLVITNSPKTRRQFSKLMTPTAKTATFQAGKFA